jgi:hypothetical protein
MAAIPAHRRPHYPATERMAILELKAARRWNQVQAAKAMMVTPATVASWSKRIDERGPDALVQLPEPVNRFPDFVRQIVRRLKAPCPSMGKVRIAKTLGRRLLPQPADRHRPSYKELGKTPVPACAGRGLSKNESVYNQNRGEANNRGRVGAAIREGQFLGRFRLNWMGQCLSLFPAPGGVAVTRHATSPFGAEVTPVSSPPRRPGPGRVRRRCR